MKCQHLIVSILLVIFLFLSSVHVVDAKTCCRICVKGEPCGNTCISKQKICSIKAGEGCACKSECCKLCDPSKSKPCGDSCIPLDRQCHKPTGCACGSSKSDFSSLYDAFEKLLSKGDAKKESKSKPHAQEKKVKKDEKDRKDRKDVKDKTGNKDQKDQAPKADSKPKPSSQTNRGQQERERSQRQRPTVDSWSAKILDIARRMGSGPLKFATRLLEAANAQNKDEL